MQENIFIGVLSNAAWGLILLAGAFVIGGIAFLCGKVNLYNKSTMFKSFGKLTVIKSSGMQGCYTDFPQSKNKELWKLTTEKLCYLGVSADSIVNDLIEFMATDKGRKLKYKFLLLDPKDEESLIKQNAFRYGIDDVDLITDAQKIFLKDAAILDKNKIVLSLEKIKKTDCFNNGNVEIKHSHETLPWWMYVIDDNKIFVGLLEPGKSGVEGPLIILEKSTNTFNLYHAFENNWKRIWQNVSKV